MALLVSANNYVIDCIMVNIKRNSIENIQYPIHNANDTKYLFFIDENMYMHIAEIWLDIFII